MSDKPPDADESIHAPAYEQPAENFLIRMNELAETTLLSIQSIAGMQGMTRLVEVLHGKDEDAAIRIERAGELERLAKREADEGFPNVLEQATIGIWTALEIVIDDFVLQWLAEFPGAIVDERIRNIAVKFSVEEALSIDTMSIYERIEHVMVEVRQSLNVPRSSSPGRFRTLLSAVGVELNSDRDMRRDLIRLWAIRNLYVHRGRRADEVFLSQYPGDDYLRGDLVRVSQPLFLRFHEASRHFVADVIQAARESARGSRA